MNDLLFSIIMPVYNGSKYIREAINSVIGQTYPNWELLIVDDESTDDTVSIIKKEFLNDSRIRLIKQKHKGTAGATRNTALNFVKGEYVQILDSDDYLSPDCLEKKIELLSKTERNVDIIIPKAYAIDDLKKISQEWLKPDGKDFISGIEGFNYSISWKIHGWFCVKTDLLKKIKYEDEIVNGDELTTRKLLFNSNVISFSDGIYFYRINSNSTTRSIENRIRMFEVQKTAYKLFLYAKENSMEYKSQRLCAINYSNVLFNNIINYIVIKDEIDKDKSDCLVLMLKEGLTLLKPIMLDVSIKGVVLFLGFGNLNIIIFVIKFMMKLRNLITRIFIQNKALKEIKKNEKRQKKLIQKKYKNCCTSNIEKKVVVLFNGNIAAGGLCDRLRGVISIYQSCKENNVPFKLLFNSPFRLEEFMEPNIYNWIIKSDELIYDKKSRPIFLSSQKGTEKEAIIQKKYVKKIISSNYNQLHFYTNAHYSLYSDTYSEDFKELFKPTDRIVCELEKYIPKNEEYISVSFRFLQLLGDFDEKYKDIYAVLPDQEKQKYIQKGINFLIKLHEKEGKKIFVATDSKTFLEESNKLPFVFIVPGEIAHVDVSNDDSFEANKKTFIDFYMIANASKVYLGHTGAMHYSGFPKNAALLSGKEFEIVEY